MKFLLSGCSLFALTILLVPSALAADAVKLEIYPSTLNLSGSDASAHDMM